MMVYHTQTRRPVCPKESLEHFSAPDQLHFFYGSSEQLSSELSCWNEGGSTGHGHGSDTHVRASGVA